MLQKDPRISPIQTTFFPKSDVYIFFPPTLKYTFVDQSRLYARTHAESSAIAQFFSLLHWAVIATPDGASLAFFFLSRY